jgi:DNA-binding MarR family transcriptional regulator
MPEFDSVIHQPLRLRIMAVLAALGSGDRVDFSYLKDFLGTTDGNLGAHLLKLEEAGYITSEKTFKARKPRTFVHITHKGRGAFQDHVASLQAILKPPLERRKR